MEMYQQRIFDIGDVVKRGWEVFKENAGMAIGGWFIAAIAMNFLGIGATIFEQVGLSIRDDGVRIPLVGISIVLRLCNIPIQFWITGGMLYYFTKMIRGESFSIGDLFPTDLRKILNLIAANLLIGLAVCIGLLLFIVPGIILALMWSQTLYLIMDQDMGPIEAMKASAEAMKGNKLNFFLLGLLACFVGIIAILLTCGIGIFVVSPWFMLVGAAVYVIVADRGNPQEV